MIKRVCALIQVLGLLIISIFYLLVGLLWYSWPEKYFGEDSFDKLGDKIEFNMKK